MAEIEEPWTTGARCRIDADVQGGNGKRYLAMGGCVGVSVRGALVDLGLGSPRVRRWCTDG